MEIVLVLKRVTLFSLGREKLTLAERIAAELVQRSLFPGQSSAQIGRIFDAFKNEAIGREAERGAMKIEALLFESPTHDGGATRMDAGRLFVAADAEEEVFEGIAREFFQ